MDPRLAACVCTHHLIISHRKKKFSLRRHKCLAGLRANAVPVNGLALFRMAIYSLRPMQTEVTDIHGNVRNSRKPNRR